MLTFEEELMAFQVAIFLAIFPPSSFLNTELSSKGIVEFIRGRFVDLSKEVNFYIHPDVLHHGFKLFKKTLSKNYGICFEEKRSHAYSIPEFYGLKASERGFSIKIPNCDFVGTYATAMTWLPGHKDALLNSIVEIRNMLLEKKEMPASSFLRQDSVLYITSSGDHQDKRPKQPQLSAAGSSPLSSSTNVIPQQRAGCDSIMSPQYQDKVCRNVVKSVEFALSKSNRSPEDKSAIISGNSFEDWGGIQIIPDCVLCRT